MNSEAVPGPEGRMKPRLARFTIVLVGVVFGQALMYGHSLVGGKLLLPLDLLAQPGTFLPRTPEIARIEPQNPTKLDLICASEPARRFAAAELRAGRLPMWAPYHFAGAPFVWPKFSLFRVMECCTESPVVLAWSQLLAAVVAGLGMYLFCRRVLRVGFWPAAICAWCYPLTGFFVLWQGYPTADSVCWLPWMLLAVDGTLRRPRSLAPIGLSATTGLVLSGQLDTTAQVLLVSGLYALWHLAERGGIDWLRTRVLTVVPALVVAWTLGFALASPAFLSVLDYARTGARMERRSAGAEERPPAGLSALPQSVLPDMYGTDQSRSLRLVSGYQVESSAAAYTGMVATLVIAPLAWRSRRHRGICGFFTAMVFLGLSWCLNVPGVVDLLRLPGLNMMSHNRLVFVVCFALLAMAAIGLEALRQEPLQWRPWFCVPAAVVAGLCAWCVWRSVVPPRQLADLDTVVREAKTGSSRIHTMNDVREVQRTFAHYFVTAALGCGAGLAAWWLLWQQRCRQAPLVPVLGAMMVGDLLWFAHGRSVQCDPALYFPRVSVLEEVAKAAPGRIIGYQCLPASLASMCGLRDIRGYDAVDPAALMDLMGIAADRRSVTPPHGLTQFLVPKLSIGPEGLVRLSPILDMLGVNYVIFRGSPPPNVRPSFQGFDYWAVTNSTALPRVFVPRRVEVVADEDSRLRLLAAPQFNAREVAYVECAVNLPSSCRGAAEIVSESPARILVSAQMETPGLIVLADLWDKGWRARLNGKPVPILQANHALRGVVVPPGAWKLEFEYWPASFTWGLALSGVSAMALLSWAAVIVFHRRRFERPGRVSLPG